MEQRGTKQRRKNAGYIKMKRKLYMRMLGLAGLSPILIYLLYSQVFSQRFANWLVEMLQRFFGMDYESALHYYQTYVRNNFSAIIMAAALVCFLLLFWFFLSSFSRYFREIDGGLDKLISKNDAAIRLSEEMEPMERKLNEIRSTLKRHQQEARQAEERKNSLVMYLAHDIRTPLTSVIGYLSLLEEAPDMPPEQRAKYVHITLEKAYRLEQLINEFFEITRFNFQQMVLEKEEIDLYYLLMQLTEEFYPILSVRGNRANLHGDENTFICGDAKKLARVFNNILKNAAAYSDSDSIIDIFLKKQKDIAVIEFHNQGRTIPKEKLNIIFERFYRLDTARTSDTGGAGLGLAIAKEIVSLHGGELEAESENGHTIFRVTLPRGILPTEDGTHAKNQCQ